MAICHIFYVQLMGKVHLIHDTRPLKRCLHMLAMTTHECNERG